MFQFHIFGVAIFFFFFFSSRRRHTRFDCDCSSDVCSSDLGLFARNQPLSAAQRVEVTELTGQVALIWTQIEQGVDNAGDAPALANVANQVRTKLITEGEPRLQELVAAAREGRPSPISEAEWPRWLAPVLNSVLGLRDAALTFAHEANDTAIAQA